MSSVAGGAPKVANRRTLKVNGSNVQAAISGAPSVADDGYADVASGVSSDVIDITGSGVLDSFCIYAMTAQLTGCIVTLQVDGDSETVNLSAILASYHVPMVLPGGSPPIVYNQSLKITVDNSADPDSALRVYYRYYLNP